MQAIVYALAWVRVSSAPAGAASASSTAVTIDAHAGVSTPDRTPAPSKVASGLTEAVLKLSSFSGGIGQGPGVDLRDQPGQIPQAHPGLGRTSRISSATPAAVLGELVGPGADGPGVGLRHLPRRQHRGDLGMRGGPPGPRGVGHRGALGDPRLIDIMLDSWTTCRQTGRKPSSGRACTPV